MKHDKSMMHPEKQMKEMHNAMNPGAQKKKMDKKAKKKGKK